MTRSTRRAVQDPSPGEPLSRAALLADLAQRLSKVPGATRRENSRWAEGPCFYCADREVAHFHRDGSLDIRLTSEVVRAAKADRSLDPRVLTRGPSAHWVKLRVQGVSDVALAVSLLEEALRANS